MLDIISIKKVKGRKLFANKFNLFKPKLFKIVIFKN